MRSFDPPLGLVAGWEPVRRGGETLLTGPGGETVALGPLDPLAASALERLIAGSPRESELVRAALADRGWAGTEGTFRLLFTLHDHLLLARRALAADGRPLAEAVPLVPACRFAGSLPEEVAVLSRFAFARRDGAGLVVESPRSLARIRLAGPGAAAFLAALAEPGDPTRLEERLDGLLTPDEVADLRRLFAAAGFLVSAGEEAEDSDEEQSGALGLWEFHDLLFHSRSRAGRSGLPYGGLYLHEDRRPPLPALKEPMDGAEVPLPSRAAAPAGPTEEPGFWEVLASRRSRRRHARRGLRLDQLGELLHRVARAGPVESGGRYELARRVYPGGGGAWELEVYLAVERCEGLDPGFYHYQAGAHRLTRLRPLDEPVQSLLASARRAARIEDCQVLLVLGARFGRLSWKYASMAYATVLKDVGVFYQSVYLAATALGLAACALGGGDAERFAEATGLDPLEESSVGEMLLGLPAD